MKSEKKKNKMKVVEEPVEVKDEQQSDNESSQNNTDNEGDSKPGQENPCMYNLLCHLYLGKNKKL